MYLWPHQLQKTNDKKSNLCCMKKRDCSTDANMKTVRANFLTRLHRTWVWWTRTKKRKLNRFSMQNLETIVWKKKKKKKKEKKKKENGKMNLSCMNWRKLFWSCILQNGVPSLGVLWSSVSVHFWLPLVDFKRLSQLPFPPSLGSVDHWHCTPVNFMRLFLLVNMLRHCGLLRIAQTNGIAMLLRSYLKRTQSFTNILVVACFALDRVDCVSR